MRTNYKDLLVMYKGGGYDGCYWEWNFFLFDPKGKFHQIKSTGRKGLKTKEEAIELIKEDMFNYSFKLTNKKAIKEFSSETNNHLVDVCAQYINKVYGRDVITWTCDDCGDECAEPMLHDDNEYHWESKYCESCYCSRSCGYCGAFNEPEQNNANEEGRCVYCIPKEGAS